MFEGIGKLINTLLILFVIFVPFGLWKVVELIIWAFSHVNVSIN